MKSAWLAAVMALSFGCDLIGGGAAGPQGAKGDPGAPGASVTALALSPGEDPACPSGGTRFMLGSEVVGRACNGSPGAPGTNGQNGIVASVSTSGTGGAILANSKAWEFYGPTATVSTTASQKILAFVSASLGMSAPGVIGNAWVDACYQSTASGSEIRSFSQDVGGLYVDVEDHRTPVATQVIAVPGAGTWRVGFCVQNVHATQDIENNDFASGVFLVTN